MKKRTAFILLWVLLFLNPAAYAQDIQDSLRTSVSLNYNFGGMWGNNENFELSQGINPSFNLLYKKLELGLGLDYYHSSFQRGVDFREENYLGFSPYLRRYLGKREYFFVETFLNTGYYWSEGMDPLLSDRYLTRFGIGVGAKLHLNRLDKYAFWRHVDFNIYLRQSLINRDNPLGSTDIKVGIMYRFK